MHRRKLELKILMISLSLALLVSSGSSDPEFDSNSYTETYGSTWTPGVNTINSVIFEGCGGAYSTGSLVTIGKPNVEIPGDLPCGKGSHNIDLKVNTGTGFKQQDSTTLNVESWNMQDPNKGDYIFTEFHHYGEGEVMEHSTLTNYFLTNEKWSGSIFVEPPSDGAYYMRAMFGEWLAFNFYETGILIPDYGNIINKGDTDIGLEHQDSDLLGGKGGGTWHTGYTTRLKKAASKLGITASPSDTAHLFLDRLAPLNNLDQTNDKGQPFAWFNKNGCETGSFGYGSYSFSECSPLHKGKTYDTDGEIIVATEPDEGPYGSGFDSSSLTDNKHVVGQSITNFFVCRGDYKGSNVVESKIVREQLNDKPEYQYYRCNDDKEWEEFECPPGTQVGQAANGDWECLPEDPITVDVEFFNLTQIRHSVKTDGGTGYMAGFRISQTELDELYEAGGNVNFNVDAQCWMGKGNQRPGFGSDSALFTKVYDGTDSNLVSTGGTDYLYMVEQLPKRDSLSTENRGKYSCIWGFRHEDDSGDDWVESAATDPVKSVETSVTKVNVEHLENNYGSTNSIGKLIWKDKYRHPDNGGIDERGAPFFDNLETDGNKKNFWMFNSYSGGSYTGGEYPYCRGTGIWGSPPSYIGFTAGSPEPLQNVVCSGGSPMIEFEAGEVNESVPELFINGPSTVEKGETYEYSSEVQNGDPENYRWMVGNQTQITGKNIEKTFESAGNLTVNLTVELDTGEKIETSRKLSVKSEKGTAEHFEIAYLPANFDTQEEYESAVETAQSMAESHLPGIHAENIEENTVDINSCNLDCVIGEGEGQRCINKVNQCVGESSSKPLDSEDANIFHVLCDDDGGEECGTADVLGLASVGGHGSTRWRETDIRDNKETFMHELGHQMGLRHIFSESMLEEKQYGDQVQNIEESTIDGCWIPNEYLENTVLGQNVVDWNGDGLGFPNSEDKYSGGSTDAFFMSYCDSQNRYGPEAGNSIRDYMGVYQ